MSYTNKDIETIRMFISQRNESILAEITPMKGIFADVFTKDRAFRHILEDMVLDKACLKIFQAKSNAKFPHIVEQVKQDFLQHNSYQDVAVEEAFAFWATIVNPNYVPVLNLPAPQTHRMSQTNSKLPSQHMYSSIPDDIQQVAPICVHPMYNNDLEKEEQTLGKIFVALLCIFLLLSIILLCIAYNSRLFLMIVLTFIPFCILCAILLETLDI